MPTGPDFRNFSAFPLKAPRPYQLERSVLKHKAEYRRRRPPTSFFSALWCAFGVGDTFPTRKAPIAPEGLFLLMGVIVDITEWFKHRSSPYYHRGGEPGSGMDDGE